MTASCLDELDSLGSIIIKQEPSDDVSHAAAPQAKVKREPVDETEGHSAKKRRRAQSTKSQAPPVDDEDAEEDEGADDSDCDEVEVLTCHGCGRVQGSDMSIIDVNVIVPWAFKRGRWCRDCHNTWRNKHSQEHTLVMFAKWLKCLPNKKICQMNVWLLRGTLASQGLSFPSELRCYIGSSGRPASTLKAG